MPESPDIPDSIRQRLDALRGRLRVWQWVTGGGRVLAVASALLLLSLLVDRTWRMDFSQRLLSLVLAVALMAWLTNRYLLRPLRRSISDDALVQTVERRFPALGSALISALQFSRDGVGTQEASPLMVRSAIQQGEAAAGTTDFNHVLDWQRFKCFLALAVTALVIPLILTAAKPMMMQMWFQRNVLLGNIEWPKRTTLEIDGLRDGSLYVPADGDLVITVTARGETPEDVRLTYVDAAGESFDDQLPLSGDGKYRAEFPAVLEPFRFRVAGGDDRSDWLDVVVLPRPEVLSLDVTARLPDYLQGETRAIAQSRMAYDVLEGSQVSLAVSASLPIASYSLTCDGELVVEDTVSGTSFHVPVPADNLRSGSYLLRLISASGVPSLRPTSFALRLQPDRAPELQADLSGIGQLVLARARLPVTVVVNDDYGLAGAALEFRAESAAATASIADEPALALTGPAADGSYTGQAVIDLQGRGLTPETTITLRARATDVNTRSGPGVGYSSGFTMRVVTDDELRTDFQRREQAMRSQFEGALAVQQGQMDESRLFASGNAGDTAIATARQLRLEKRQHQLIRTVDQMHRDYSQLRDELVNNRLEAPPSETRERYEGRIITPLDELRRSLLPAAVDAISRARASSGDEAPAAWRDAVTVQKRVIDAMLAIRKHLAQSEDVQKAIRLLQGIMDDQNTVLRDTKEKSESEIEGLFDD